MSRNAVLKIAKDYITTVRKNGVSVSDAYLFQIDSRIELHPMSPADFAEKYNLLAHEVKTYGIKII